MIDKIKYSFIVPLFRTSNDLLVRCIKSVLICPRDDIELLLIEAPFEGRFIYQQEDVTDQRIRYIRSSVASAPFQRNLGLEACGGDFIIFVDSDDYINPTFLEIGDLVIRDFPDADLYVFNHTSGDFDSLPYRHSDVLVAGERDVIGDWFDTSSRSRPHFMEKSIWAKIYRRSAIEKAGLRFDTNLLSTQDHFFNLRLVKTIGKVVCDLHYQAYHYEFSATSMTKSLTVTSPARFQTLLKAWDSLFADFPPTSVDYRNKAYNIALIYLPTMLRDYFTNPQNSQPERERLSEWKREIKKPDYRWAIRETRILECGSTRKAIFLLLLKIGLSSLVFSLYTKKHAGGKN